MPVDVQSKLLRVLQEGEIKPVGSNKSRKIDVRIIAASSKPLQKMIQDNEFREDLSIGSTFTRFTFLLYPSAEMASQRWPIFS